MLITYNKWRTSSVPSTFTFHKSTDDEDASSGSRRRKRLSSSSSTTTSSSLKLSARFVASTKNWRKRSLCLTSPHQLHTIDSSNSQSLFYKKASNQNEKEEDVKLCFESRPGKATSFLPAQNLPDIAAVLDHSYGYALQDSNSTLVICSKKKQQKKSKINPQDSSNIDNGLLEERYRIKLSSPANSLEPLPQDKNRTVGVIGTCLDSSIFIVNFDHHSDNEDDEPKLRFNCFASDDDNKGEQKKILGTFVSYIDTKDNGQEEKEDEDFSKKRKRQTSVTKSGSTYAVCVLYHVDHHQHGNDEVTDTPTKKKKKKKKHKNPRPETHPNEATNSTGSSLIMMKHVLTLENASDDGTSMESKQKSPKRRKVTKSDSDTSTPSSVSSLNARHSTTCQTIKDIFPTEDGKKVIADTIHASRLDEQTISLVNKNKDGYICAVIDISNSTNLLVRPPFYLPLTASPTEKTVLVSTGGISNTLLAILTSTKNDNNKQASYQVLICDVHRANVVHLLNCNDDIHATAVGSKMVVSDMITDYSTGIIALLLPQDKNKAATSCRLNVATSFVLPNLFKRNGVPRVFRLATSIASSSIASSSYSSRPKSVSATMTKQRKNLKSLLNLTQSLSSTDIIKSKNMELSSSSLSIEEAISSTSTKLRKIRDSIQCFTDNKKNKKSTTVDGSTFSNAYFQGINAIMAAAGFDQVRVNDDRVNGMKDGKKHASINGSASQTLPPSSTGKKHTMRNGGLSTPRSSQRSKSQNSNKKVYGSGKPATTTASADKKPNTSPRTPQCNQSHSNKRKVDSGGKPATKIASNAKEPMTNLLSLLSQSFVETTAALTIDVIMLLKKKKLPHIGDATNVLIHLILLCHQEAFSSATTKLSIRSHVGDHFHSLLLACRSNDNKHSQDDGDDNASGSTSLDLIDVTLRYGKDVPERTLVSMVQYVLSHTTPDEVVAFFIQGPCSTDNLGATIVHNELSFAPPQKKLKGTTQKKDTRSLIMKLAHRYQQMKSELNSSTKKGEEANEEEEEEEELQNKLSSLSSRLLGLAAVVFMERIVSYSGCNEALLRGALHYGLTSKNEITVAIQILAKLLKRTVGTCIIRWISALADAHIGTLIGNDGDDEDDEEGDKPKFAFDPIMRMKRAVLAAFHGSNKLFTIKDLLDLDSASSTYALSRGTASGEKASPIEGRAGTFDSQGRKKLTNAVAKDAPLKAPVANYSIELLEF